MGMIAGLHQGRTDAMPAIVTQAARKLALPRDLAQGAKSDA